MSEEEILGTINITIYEDSINHETSMSTADTVFWLETVKMLLMQDVMSAGDDK